MQSEQENGGSGGERKGGCLSRHLAGYRESCFSRLRKEDYHVTSPEDSTYNCIAHAVGQEDIWWWPVQEDIVDEEGRPTHTARQLPTSRTWTSKLGEWEDIEHMTLASLEGKDPAYGMPVKFLKRRSAVPDVQSA